jgi:hypothetical protein
MVGFKWISMAMQYTQDVLAPIALEKVVMTMKTAQ